MEKPQYPRSEKEKIGHQSLEEHTDKYNERLIHNLSEYNLTKEGHHLLCKRTKSLP